MTISSTVRKAGPFVGNGSAATFSFSFKVFAASDLLVVKLTVATGIETTLALTTDYTVSLNSDQNSNPGGSITLVAGALASGYNLVITSDIDNLQPTDLTNQGGFYPEVITTALDRATIQIQQLQEGVNRSAKLPVTSAVDATALSDDIYRLADSANNIDTVAANIANVNTVAGNSSNINAVAGNATNINVVAGNTANITTVAGVSSNVTTVATNIANVNTTATNIVNVNAFSNVYYGPSATNPTARQNSTPLQNGDLYFNTVASVMRVYNGVAWADVAQGVSTPYATFSGNGSQTAFTLSSAPGSLGSVEVYISGVRQVPGTDYTISGATLTFTSAPPSGTSNIFTRWISTQAINVPADGSVSENKIASGAVTADKLASSIVTPAKLANSGDELGMRNRIINGGMRIDQRNAGASVSYTGTKIAMHLDRWRGVQIGSSMAFTLQRSTDAPAGFSNSIAMSVTTAKASFAATDQARIDQTIEGFNVADFDFGKASAKTITVSFWVKSSITGMMGIAITNGQSGPRSYVSAVSINTPNLWEYKVITISGDTAGTWVTNDGQGLTLSFCYNVGSDFYGTLSAWNSTYKVSYSGQTNFIGTNGNEVKITGVQLELGSTVTPFERRPYGMELALCQRYCLALNTNAYAGVCWCDSTTASIGSIPTPVSLRASPTITSFSGTLTMAIHGNNTFNTTTAPTVLHYNTNSATISMTGFSGLTALQSGTFYTVNAPLVLNAEF